METQTTDMIILGSGPSGLTAAIYAARANLNPLLVAGLTPGGQLMTTSEVENYPGFPEGVMGPELMQRMLAQAKRFGATVIDGEVTAVDFSNALKKVSVAKNDYMAKAVIIATGSSPRKLGVKGEDTFWARGVSSCATCDGAFFKEKAVAVIGGGDSAMEEATFLTRFAKKVYIIHRRDAFRASQIMQDRALNDPKIEVLWNTDVLEVLGDKTVNGLKLHDKAKDKIYTLEASGMFLAIGHIPNTAFLKDAVALDEKGYIQVQDQTRTSVEGVFVAGDVKDHVYQQAVTAAGMGCMAAMDAQKWLVEKSL